MTVNDIKTAVVKRFIETGRASNADEIAKFMGVSVGVVRRVIREAEHFIPRCDVKKGNRGGRWCWEFSPTVYALREFIREEMGS